MGIKIGLEAAWDLGIRRAICESDSQSAIHLVLGQSGGFHAYACIIQRIKDILGRDLDVSLVHTYREGNM